MLREARELTGESQAKFGERLGVEQPAISRWERGEMPAEGPIQLLAQRIIVEIHAVYRPLKRQSIV
jgi:transcriptional regulator with XRE-family HTH domain